MADYDVRELTNGMEGRDRDEFRALVPHWPDWLRMLPEPNGVTDPEASPTYHTVVDGRHYALSVSPGELYEFNWSPNGKLVLYGIWNGLLHWSWIPLRSDRDINPASLEERVRALRRDLPSILAACDLSKIPEDGGLDDYDRQFEGARLLRKLYYRWSEEWDHDHCVYCSATLSLDEPGALTEGYAVQGDLQFGDDYNWICVPCLEARRGLVHYEIIGE
jgi:hypothetical protein